MMVAAGRRRAFSRDLHFLSPNEREDGLFHPFVPPSGSSSSDKKKAKKEGQKGEKD